ncbi:hypothetical protein NP233_g1215 [Leucocoprinus birnbaumii]|uniref:HAT C-terminal dimerisation domain-containing protein n=1 Tax=Leucocoprinus birnbaumii TaxID=56174 RepID=A0AAD5W0S7_9AGAR|nr:hypothetical protein NP233_g1215 [Leucocoprinus birnbaumii]
MIVNRWDESYAKYKQDDFDVSPQPPPNPWLRTAGPTTKSSSLTRSEIDDDINAFLDDKLVSSEVIQAAGGYMKWWESKAEKLPALARMAMDYCSAPASSVDAERAFSVGRRQINFMQHNMASNTFKAKMGLGSWVDSPLFPGLDEATKILERKSGEESDDDDD